MKKLLLPVICVLPLLASCSDSSGVDDSSAAAENQSPPLQTNNFAIAISDSNWQHCAFNNNPAGADHTGFSYIFDAFQYEYGVANYSDSDTECTGEEFDAEYEFGTYRVVGQRESSDGFSVDVVEFTHIRYANFELPEPQIYYRDVYIDSSQRFFTSSTISLTPNLDGTGSVSLEVPFFAQ